MNEENAREAADLLWQCWYEGSVIAALPESVCPQTRIDGYAIQAYLEKRTESTLYGWKIAATSVGGQRHIGVDGPLAGRLLREQVRDPDATISLQHNRMRVAECEFAFRVGADLTPRAEHYSVEEVLAAITSLHPAIEIPDSRFRAFETAGAPQLIADNACAHLFVLGGAASETWRETDLASHPVLAVLERDGSSNQIDGIGANVLGDPAVALAWLVNELSSLGITIRRDEVITTGTCVVPIAIQPGDQLAAGFGALGAVAVSFD